jgi:DNA-binding CsgD family transcriptional regulator
MRSSHGVEGLTPCELRIVRLAQDGRTNRQIAQDLYVSIKTVEGHLARAYGKLGIRARAGLSRVLGSPKTRRESDLWAKTDLNRQPTD